MSFISNMFGGPAAPPAAPSASSTKPQQERVNDFADELKRALLSVGRGKDGQVIGVQLGNRAAFQKQVDDLVSSIKTSYTSYSTEIGKAQKIKELNKNLVTNFRRNLQVMVDVTNLLTSYVQLFDVIKAELVKINSLIGKDVNLDDISYLEQITQRQIETLQKEFEKQTTTLDTLYGQYDLGAERQHIGEAKTQMADIIRSATEIYTQRGGLKHKSKGKGRKVKKQQTT